MLASHRRVSASALLAAALLSETSAARAQPAATAEPPPAEPPPAGAVTLDVGAHLGAGVRLDDPPAIDATERAGLAFGGGVFVMPSRVFGIGLGYEHLSLGHERSVLGTFGEIDVDRDLSTVWASVRAYLLRAGPAAFFLGIAPGLVWQSADATGVDFTGPFASRPVPFTCEGSAGASHALRASIGVEGELSQHLRLVGETSIDAYRLSSDLLDGCAPGAGSATVFGLRAGLAYRFDVTRVVR